MALRMVQPLCSQWPVERLYALPSSSMSLAAAWEA
jgi:hypothetical protein